MLFEPAQTVCPPDRTANFVDEQLAPWTSVFTTLTTSVVHVGWTMQDGASCALTDQYDEVRLA
jgi:hypothetical protein